jgi:hypothetical protein
MLPSGLSQTWSHVAGEGARNVGGVGQLLGYLKMKIQKADGSGDISEKGFGNNPYRTYTLNVSGQPWYEYGSASKFYLGM